MSSQDRPLEHLLRTEAPQVLGALVRRFGHFEVAEDAVQDALLAAFRQWPVDGVPDQPRGWLIRVGYRRMVDMLRREHARRERELASAAREAPTETAEPAAGADDSLTLLFLCCHPSLSPTSQVALTLRAVGGLTTAEIAHAYGAAEAAMAQRISRAKQQIREAGGRFLPPPAETYEERLAIVCQVLCLIFNEGYTASSGDRLERVDLSTEAIRLARMLHRLAPNEPEVAGLLSLMLLTQARRAARTSGSGDLITMAEQDRSRWDQALIVEGTELITSALRQAPVGPVPAPGGNSSPAQPGSPLRRHRLATNRRPLRPARTADPDPDDSAQPGRCRTAWPTARHAASRSSTSCPTSRSLGSASGRPRTPERTRRRPGGSPTSSRKPPDSRQTNPSSATYAAVPPPSAPKVGSEHAHILTHQPPPRTRAQEVLQRLGRGPSCTRPAERSFPRSAMRSVTCAMLTSSSRWSEL